MKGKIILFSAWLCALSAYSQVEKVNYKLTKLSDHSYILTRNWGEPWDNCNMGFVIGEKGVLLINPFYRDEVDQLMVEIRKVTDKPIQYVINSNWDSHNTDANWYFKDQNVTIISHRNIVYSEDKHTQLVFENEITLDLGTEIITAYRSYGHSFGHINIHLDKANATFMSDSFRSQWMTIEGPFGLEGMFKGIDRALEMGNAGTKYIPGNTSYKIDCDKGDLLTEKRRRTEFAELVIELHKKGKSKKEILTNEQIRKIIAEYPMYQYIEEEIGNWVIDPVFFDHQARTHGFDMKSFSHFVGTYGNSKNEVELVLEGDYLFARSRGNFYYRLVPISKHEFLFDIQQLHQTITIKPNGSQLEFSVYEQVYTKNQDVNLN